jgi:hypothetical protein
MASANKVLLSTSYLPPVSWMKAVIATGNIEIEAHETYPKQTYRNRCRIMTANGVLPLSIAVNKVNGKNTKTKDIEIFYGESWQRLHWRSIDAAYSNSPYYLYYKDELENFYTKKYRFLLDFNTELLQTILKLMKLSINIELSNEYIHDPADAIDLRQAFTPKMEVDIKDFSPYHQVFEDRNGFVADLSFIDLLFNEGPNAVEFINESS